MLVLLAAAHAADSTTVGGIVRAQLAYDPVRDYAVEDFFTDSTYARAWAEGEFDRGDRWFIEGRFQHHLLMADTNSTPILTPDFEGWWDAGVGETGWDGKVAGPVTLRIGALIERWGRLDLLPVADVLNAHDYRAGLLAPVEFQKIPEPMAVIAVSGGPVRFETVLVPFASADRVFLRETNWSFLRKGMTADLLGEMAAGDGTEENPGWVTFGDNSQVMTDQLVRLRGTVSEEDPSLRRGLDAAILGNELPQAFWVNGEIAERIEITARNLDVGLMAGWLRSTQAETTLSPVLIDILKTESITGDPNELDDLLEEVSGEAAIVRWPRTLVAGADLGVLAGPIQIRAETLWTENRVLRMPYGQATVRPSIGAGLGLDYVRGSNFLATIEGRYTHIFDAPGQMLLTLEDQVQVAGLVRWTVANDRLTLQGGGAFDPTFVEYAAAGPAIGWRVNDHVLLELGGAVLIGKTPAPGELLDKDDGRAYDALTYTGGPASFFQQNDAITFAVQLIR